MAVETMKIMESGRDGQMLELVKKYKLLIREMFLYGVFGMTSAGIDTLSFWGLSYTSMPVLGANFISVNLGITVSFFLNTFVNFRKSTGICFCSGGSAVHIK